jgi:hypothetical protein
MKESINSGPNRCENAPLLWTGQLRHISKDLLDSGKKLPPFQSEGVVIDVGLGIFWDDGQLSQVKTMKDPRDGRRNVPSFRAGAIVGSVVDCEIVPILRNFGKVSRVEHLKKVFDRRGKIPFFHLGGIVARAKIDNVGNVERLSQVEILEDTLDGRNEIPLWSIGYLSQREIVEEAMDGREEAPFIRGERTLSVAVASCLCGYVLIGC